MARNDWTLKMRAEVIGRDRSTCWVDGPWYHDKDGYGIISVGGVSRRAHRYALELDSGEEGDGRHALHSCDTPSCYNPAHLRWGTDADNVADRDRRGRKADGRKTKNGWTEKVNEELVVEIRRRYDAGEATAAQLAREYGVTDSTMSKIVLRRTWKWVA